ncbi:MAG TPA: hypothetical protein VLH39_04655, partial [Magnetospirillaceae bacterium]|nr:hypothetical protein [Magnetospirillaceae bacterium]
SIFAAGAYAQGEPPAVELPDATLSANPFVRGAQTLSFSLGTNIPLAFINLYAGGLADDTNLRMGAGFGISYSYVLSTGFSIGGSVGGATHGTTAESSFFMVPFTAKASWYFVRMPFEIVPSLSAGIAIVRYQDFTNFNPIFKAGAAFLWRQSSTWSFGLDTQAWTVWQFYGDWPEDNRLGIFLDARLTAVYHL